MAVTLLVHFSNLFSWNVTWWEESTHRCKQSFLFIRWPIFVQSYIVTYFVFLYAYPKNSIKKYGSAAIILNDLNQDFDVLQFINVKTDRMDIQKWTIQETQTTFGTQHRVKTNKANICIIRNGQPVSDDGRIIFVAMISI